MTTEDNQGAGDGTGPNDSQTGVIESSGDSVKNGALSKPGKAGDKASNGEEAEAFALEAPAVPLSKKPASDEEELTAAAQDDLKLLAEAARFASPERVGQ